MTRICRSVAVASAVVVSVAGRSAAQPPAPGVLTRPGPAVSPFLNLTRRDVDPAINYYGIVRPQVATASALRSLQQQIAPSVLPTTANQPAVDPTLPITGQPTYFLNTGNYFLNSRTGMTPLTTNRTTRPPQPTAAPAIPRPAAP
jgi:hypothetical protein